MLYSYNNHKGFSLIELLVVVGIIGILAAVGIVSYIGYVAGAQQTDAQSKMQSIYLAEENFRASNAFNQYYTTQAGNVCAPVLANSATINTDLFSGNQQLDVANDADFLFCIAGGGNNDGGFIIFSARPDGTDAMTLNANNVKTGW